MKKISSIIWGLLLIGIGVVIALNALNITDIDLFFDGWWTLFIIVPCAIGLFTEREKTGNAIGLLVGVVLLLCCQNVFDFSLAWKLLIPAIIVVIGLKMVLSGFFGNKANVIIKKIKADGRCVQTECAIFSGADLNYAGDHFEGVELVAVFGGVKCDLRNAIIEKDCAIQATAIFGGIDILVSENVNVKVVSNSIFGGTANKTIPHPEAPTLYVNATSLFGGIDIK